MQLCNVQTHTKTDIVTHMVILYANDLPPPPPPALTKIVIYIIINATIKYKITTFIVGLA